MCVVGNKGYATQFDCRALLKTVVVCQYQSQTLLDVHGFQRVDFTQENAAAAFEH
jgi:hypothetical protein